MTDWQLVCLVIIAISVAVMAVIQVGIVIAGAMVARQLSAGVQDLRREIQPLMEKVNRVADEAVRTSALVSAQAERLDRIVSTTTTRVDEVSAIIQNAMGGPIRQGAAAFMAMRAVISAFRNWQGTPSRRRARQVHREEEDALFVG